jgi:hypothetical protein
VARSDGPYRRYHAVQEFNRGVFDYLIATDESGLEGHDRDTNEEDVEEKGETAGCTFFFFCLADLSKAI